jgi:cytidylate kinase
MKGGGRREPVITIDGPVGAGKSTVSRALAARLGYRFVDTGAMYRALAWSVLAAGVDPDDGPALRRHLESIELDTRADRVYVGGRDVTGEIRTREISELTSRLSMLEPVRAKVTPLQRRLAAGGGVVLEGRDTGTVVCPDAEVKFYLTATQGERARRRQAEFRARGMVVDIAVIRREIGARDIQDQTRALAPLRKAPDAVEIDTDGKTIEQVVESMLWEIEQRCCTRS